MSVYILTAYLPCSETYADDKSRHPYRITIGYWNDNFLLNDLYESDTFHGPDDYVTASFWLQSMVQAKDTVWRIDLYHNALTNRAENYRTDLLTIRLSGERSTAIGPIQAGFGIVANGHFIGETVQNGYHRLIGHDQVYLPYTVPEHTEPLVFLRYAPILAEWGMARSTAYLSNAHRFAVGASAFRSGIEVSNKWQTTDKNLHFYLSMHTGFIWFYNRDSYLKPMFENGLVWGVMGAFDIVDKHMVSFWVTRNQYGRNQPHFGISYSYASGYNNLPISSISDVLIP